MKLSKSNRRGEQQAAVQWFARATEQGQEELIYRKALEAEHSQMRALIMERRHGIHSTALQRTLEAATQKKQLKQ